MNIEFIQAKNGEETAKINSVFIHSTYSPSNEAKRVIQNLIIPFTPSCILLIEPCLNYFFPLIKEKYPKSKIGIIRFSHDFDKFNFDNSFIIYANEENIKQKLFEYLSEEELCSTFCLPWEPIAKVFSDLNKNVWNNIKNTFEQAKTILISREYFESKWFLNCCKNLSNLKTNYSLSKKIDSPIFIIASGPSLLSKLEFIKQNQNKAFIICLSSAISVLLNNDIHPDLCFSTDGGYWAGEHLKQLNKNRLILALTSEAYCPENIFSFSNIMLLNYPEGISSELMNELGINNLLAKRNGTVSGTALDFCLDYSNESIFFFGLDLHAGKGFQHTNPNELEKNTVIKDYRLNNVEKRMTNSISKSDSLLIYENWFKNKNLHGRNVFRVIEKNEANNNLNQIKDISLNEIDKIFQKIKVNKKDLNYYIKQSQIQIDMEKLYKSALSKLSDEHYLQMIFPLDYVALNHNSSDNQIIEQRIQHKTEKLKAKLEKMFNENL